MQLRLAALAWNLALWQAIFRCSLPHISTVHLWGDSLCFQSVKQAVVQTVSSQTSKSTLLILLVSHVCASDLMYCFPWSISSEPPAMRCSHCREHRSGPDLMLQHLSLFIYYLTPTAYMAIASQDWCYTKHNLECRSRELWLTLHNSCYFSQSFILFYSPCSMAHLAIFFRHQILVLEM